MWATRCETIWSGVGRPRKFRVVFGRASSPLEIRAHPLVKFVQPRLNAFKKFFEITNQKSNPSSCSCSERDIVSMNVRCHILVLPFAPFSRLLNDCDWPPLTKNASDGGFPSKHCKVRFLYWTFEACPSFFTITSVVPVWMYIVEFYFALRSLVSSIWHYLCQPSCLWYSWLPLFLYVKYNLHRHVRCSDSLDPWYTPARIWDGGCGGPFFRKFSTTDALFWYQSLSRTAT